MLKEAVAVADVMRAGKKEICNRRHARLRAPTLRNATSSLASSRGIYE